jgi:hypothetical protein
MILAMVLSPVSNTPLSSGRGAALNDHHHTMCRFQPSLSLRTRAAIEPYRSIPRKIRAEDSARHPPSDFCPPLPTARGIAASKHTTNNAGPINFVRCCATFDKTKTAPVEAFEGTEICNRRRDSRRWPKCDLRFLAQLTNQRNRQTIGQIIGYYLINTGFERGEDARDLACDCMRVGACSNGRCTRRGSARQSSLLCFLL